MNDIEKAIETLQNYSPCSQENLYQAHQVAISALEEQLNGGWISVNDRMPEYDSKCLVTTENGEVFTSKFYGYGEECQGFKEFPEGVWEINEYGEGVVAWQPLPERFKETI